MTEPRFLARGEQRQLSAASSLADFAEAGLIGYVISGAVCCEYLAGTETIPFDCGPGELLGVVDAYGGGACPSSRVTVTEETTLYVWTRDAFDLALGMYQELARLTIQSLSLRLRAVNEHARRLNGPHGRD